MHCYFLPVHRYIYRWTAKFTGASVNYTGAPVIFTGPPVNFTGAPVFVMTLWQYRRTGITLTYHPIRSRLVSHSIQVNLMLCKRTMKSHHYILSIIAVLKIVVYFKNYLVVPGLERVKAVESCFYFQGKF